MSSTIVGINGNEEATLKCNIHEFVAKDMNEFNEHCKTEEGHTEQGVTTCTNCGMEVPFNNIPYQSVRNGSKGINFKCPECYNQGQDLNRLALQQGGNNNDNNSNGEESTQ